MMSRYKQAQEEQSMLSAELAEKPTHSLKADDDIHEWVSLIRSCMNLKKLDTTLLIRLISKIVVGQKAVVDGVERQDIDIYYNLVGIID